jgi:endonuclease/exonuclease/phosphatase family metal-dependent hydrolase
MTLNVLHGYPAFVHMERRFDLIAREIRYHDADIVCLQEVPWTWHLGSGAQYLGKQTGLNYLYVRANGNRHAILFEEGVAILSRYALREPHFIELEPRAGFFEHRVALYATAMTPWGAIRVFVTHLTPTDPHLNSAQTAALQDFVEQTGNGLAIIAGDLNATEELPHIQALSSEWLDVYRAANPDDAGLTCCIKNLIGSPRVRLKKRIDYIFLTVHATSGVQVLATRRVFDQPFQVAQDWQWASDHVGLLAVIRLTPRGVHVG